MVRFEKTKILNYIKNLGNKVINNKKLKKQIYRK